MKAIKKTKAEQKKHLSSILTFFLLILSILAPYLLGAMEKHQQEEQEINYIPGSTASDAFYKRMDNIANPKKLTMEQVRSEEGMADISEEDANEIINGLYQLSIISYTIYNHDNGEI